VGQDYRYLTEFIKIYASVISKQQDRSEMKFFADAIDFILNSEIHPHHVFCRAAGVEYSSLQHEQPSPKAYLYESHMHQAAETGQLINIIAALLPCPWTYQEIADKLVKENKNNDANPFKDWIDFYAAADQKEDDASLTKKLFTKLDDLAEKSSAEAVKQAKRFFLISCELEWEFWQQAYYQQDWQFSKIIKGED
ncbi:transcriptional regulator, partial [Oenococcus alcoholitolerans]